MAKVAYSANKREFIQDWRNNQFMEKITQGAKNNRIGFSTSERKSWEANAAKIVNLLELSEVPSDVQIVFEYKVPSAGRVDCMLFAYGSDKKKHIVHIELKQWSNETVSQVYDTGIFKVEALVGGSYHIVSHPSQQAFGYQQNIENYIELVNNQDVCFGGHAYCYNYYYNSTPNDLFSSQYTQIMRKCPLHSADHVNDFARELKDLLSGGKGFEVFKEFISCPVRPTKNLMDCAANMFKGQREFILLEDQLTSANTIFGMVSTVLRNPNKKLALIVKGGPGTGKTVIALKVISELALKYPSLNAFFTTRSTALRDTLIEKLEHVSCEGKGSAAGLIRTIFDFRPANFKESEIDVLLVDEAHRIQNSANFMTDRDEVYTFLPQALSLMYTTKVCVFFIDDQQGVKPTEIGTSGKLEHYAKNYARLIDEYKAEYAQELKKGKQKQSYPLDDVQSSICDVDVKMIELKTQFRCNGSDNFLDWLDDVIYEDENTVRKNGISFGDEYQFNIIDTPLELEKLIRSLNCPAENPHQIARIIAGWCWEWSDELQENGDLKRDVVIGDWSMPWETKANHKPQKPYRNQYAPSAELWASHSMGINQVGCIFSVQGFELDYVGVIMGPDVNYDANTHRIVVIPGHTYGFQTKANIDNYVKNIYRVLLSRGRKGCFVYCYHKELSDYLKKMIPVQHSSVESSPPVEDTTASIVVLDEVNESEQWIEFLPFYEMRAACGYFGDGEPVEPTGWIQVTGMGHLNRNMFVVRASGSSMEPKIHDGDYCVFKANPAGSRSNKIVLVQHRAIFDPDSGGSYSIKQYTSKKQYDDFGNWTHEKIVLVPLNPEFNSIEIEESEAEDFQVIGEYIGTVSPI